MEVSGTTIRGFVNGTQIASGTNSAIGAGRIALQTFHATANFDDVLVTDSATHATRPTTSSTGAPPPPTTHRPARPPQTGLVGWATQNGGTTGGGSAATTTVTSASGADHRARLDQRRR